MNAAHWRIVNDLFHAALERDGDARPAFLAEACAGDAALVAEIERLLRAHEASQGFLAQPVAAGAFHALAEPDVSTVGAVIGPYRIVRELGRGGMGAVYLAERADEQYEKRVALKLVKRGMDTDAVLRRFRDERQILADLEHPNIARLLDGGTTPAGSPYFVMEYVDGQPIDRYCDERQLGIDERLHLFLRVCAAVSYAHQRLVVHRDIKPSNILVSGDGVPKLLDFGIAKIMRADGSDDTQFTATSFRALTPEYASPEQLQGHRVDALSDVYSLGVLLFGLLTGRGPFQWATRTPEEVARVIAATDPPKPSGVSGDAAKAPTRNTTPDRLRRRLQGDLDTIVLAALCKDRNRRYQSVEQLAEDIRRHLSRLPIVARQQSVSYRTLRFVRRHRLAVSAAALVLVTLVTGITATTWAAWRADRAERAAVLERDRATSAESQATGERDRARRAEEIATAERIRAEQERNRAEQERNNAVEAARRADQQAAVATAVNEFLQNDLLLQASARIQAEQNAKANSDLTVREALDRAAVRVADRFKGEPAVEAAIRLTIGRTYKSIGDYAKAQPQLEKALEIRRRLFGNDHLDTLTSLSDLASIHSLQGRYVHAESLWTEAVSISRHLFGDYHRETLAQLANLAGAVSNQRNDEKAIAMWSALLRVQRRVIGPEHLDTLVVMNNLAAAYLNKGQYRIAEDIHRQVFAIKQRVLGAEHPSTLTSMNALGVTFRNQGKYEEAAALLSKLLEIRHRQLGPDQPDTLLSRNSLALVYDAQGRFDLSEPLLVETLEGRRRVLGGEHPLTVGTMNNLAESYRRQGKLEQAQSMFEQVLSLRRRVLTPNNVSTLAVLVSLGEIKFEQRDHAAAQKYFAEALSAYELTKSDTWRRYYAQSMLGASLAALGRRDEGEPLLTAGYAGMVSRTDSIPIENRPLLETIKAWVGQLGQ